MGGKWERFVISFQWVRFLSLFILMELIKCSEFNIFDWWKTSKLHHYHSPLVQTRTKHRFVWPVVALREQKTMEKGEMIAWWSARVSLAKALLRVRGAASLVLDKRKFFENWSQNLFCFSFFRNWLRIINSLILSVFRKWEMRPPLMFLLIRFVLGASEFELTRFALVQANRMNFTSILYARASTDLQ